MFLRFDIIILSMLLTKPRSVLDPFPICPFIAIFGPTLVSWCQGLLTIEDDKIYQIFLLGCDVDTSPVESLFSDYLLRCYMEEFFCTKYTIIYYYFMVKSTRVLIFVVFQEELTGNYRKDFRHSNENHYTKKSRYFVKNRRNVSKTKIININIS